MKDLRGQGREAYWAAVHRLRTAAILAAHAYSLYEIAVGAPDTPDYLCLAAMQILLRIYWHEHNATLARVNARLLREFTGTA